MDILRRTSQRFNDQPGLEDNHASRAAAWTRDLRFSKVAPRGREDKRASRIAGRVLAWGEIQLDLPGRFWRVTAPMPFWKCLRGPDWTQQMDSLRVSPPRPLAPNP